MEESVKDVSILIPVIVALIVAIVGPISLEWFKNWLSKKSKKKSPIQEAININTQIENQLKKIFHELEGNRIWVAQFHNGGHIYPTGKSVQKFSIFYEYFDPKYGPISDQFQNTNISQYPGIMCKLYRNDYVKVIDSDKHKYKLEQFFDEFKTKTMYFVALSDSNEDFIGFLVIEYMEGLGNLSKENIEYLLNRSGAIGILVDKYLKQPN